MRFTKMHGAGNDYVLLDARQQERDWSALARTLCDRHFGVGSDGLLLIAQSSVADIRMRMYNPDGSEAEMCGNGIRCFAKYVLEREIVPASEGPLRVETGNGILDVMPLSGNGRINRVRVHMGAPRFHAADVPIRLPEGEYGLQMDARSLNITDALKDELDLGQLVAGYPVDVDGQRFRVTGVSMGNPHAVAFIDEPVDQVPLHLLGPVMEHHPLFPERVNFQIVNVEGRGALKARTWERGAGLTLASGTGACAIHAAAHLLGLVDDTTQVHMPGGVLALTWPGSGQVTMEGPAEEVYEGEWNE
ncbi:MAG: diaminopimelate epimerase [Chloroflexi bacterium]|nr:diaminopimelate epimerase [Chloroflexota bacterium]